MDHASRSTSSAEQIVSKLYEALGRRDYEAMASLYSPTARFSDPVFGTLTGKRIAAMWHMLCERGDDLDVTLRDVTTDPGGVVAARWEAQYSFGKDRRPVHNRIEARIKITDGAIVEHDDTFGLWRWTRMALGWRGWLTGWSSWTRKRVRRQAQKSLDRFIAGRPEYR